MGKSRTKVLLDTNALFMPFQFNIHLENELERLLGKCEIIIPNAVAGELIGMKDRKYLNSARKLARKYKMTESGSTENTDDAILETAGRLRAVVLTNDKDLQKRIILAGGRVVSLRGRNHLVLLPSHKG